VFSIVFGTFVAQNTQFMEDNDFNLDNSKLLKLIEDWVRANGKEKTYENVVLELLNGNSHLIVQTYNKVSETRKFISDENTKLELGIYEIEGKKFFGAFTSLELLEQWLKAPSYYAKLPSKALLEMADKTDIDGIVINTNSKNMFVVFRKSSRQ
jgi:ribosomal protein S3AE